MKEVMAERQQMIRETRDREMEEQKKREEEHKQKAGKEGVQIEGKEENREIQESLRGSRWADLVEEEEREGSEMELDNWSRVTALLSLEIKDEGKGKGKEARLHTPTPPLENFNFDAARQAGRQIPRGMEAPLEVPVKVLAQNFDNGEIEMGVGKHNTTGRANLSEWGKLSVLVQQRPKSMKNARAAPTTKPAGPPAMIPGTRDGLPVRTSYAEIARQTPAGDW